MYSWNEGTGLANCGMSSLYREQCSGCKSPGEKAMVDIVCTHYQHLHRDQKGRLCHFPIGPELYDNNTHPLRTSQARGFLYSLHSLLLPLRHSCGGLSRQLNLQSLMAHKTDALSQQALLLNIFCDVPTGWFQFNYLPLCIDLSSVTTFRL